MCCLHLRRTFEKKTVKKKKLEPGLRKLGGWGSLLKAKLKLKGGGAIRKTKGNEKEGTKCDGLQGVRRTVAVSCPRIYSAQVKKMEITENARLKYQKRTVSLGR